MSQLAEVTHLMVKNIPQMYMRPIPRAIRNIIIFPPNLITPIDAHAHSLRLWDTNMMPLIILLTTLIHFRSLIHPKSIADIQQETSQHLLPFKIVGKHTFVQNRNVASLSTVV